MCFAILDYVAILQLQAPAAAPPATTGGGGMMLEPQCTEGLKGLNILAITIRRSGLMGSMASGMATGLECFTMPVAFVVS